MPKEAGRELRSRRSCHERHAAPLLDHVHLELEPGGRIIAAGRHCAALVPIWACRPHEALPAPASAVTSMSGVSPMSGSAI